MKNTVNGSTRRNVRIIARLRRIQGQVAAIERSVNTDLDCSILLQRVAAARGAMSSLMAYLMEERLRSLQVEPGGEDASEAIEEMIDIIHGYLS
jgi:FrmR/RcnR family transcriptional regulator, repressor of frmRAB operon